LLSDLRRVYRLVFVVDRSLEASCVVLPFLLHLDIGDLFFLFLLLAGRALLLHHQQCLQDFRVLSLLTLELSEKELEFFFSHVLKLSDQCFVIFFIFDFESLTFFSTVGS
jgi:hypothetical protein